MTLQQDIQDFMAEMAGRIPDDVKSIMVKATQDLAATGIAEKSLAVGAKAPDFTLKNQKGEAVSSADLLAKGPLVVVFYRGEWCPYCNLELKAYERERARIEAAGATLVAISPELPDHSLTAAEKNDLAFDILSDTGSEVSSKFGLTFDLADSLKPIYGNFGIDLPARNGDGAWKLPVPGTYVINTDGTVVFAEADVDYTKRPEPADAIAALEGLNAAAA